MDIKEQQLKILEWPHPILRSPSQPVKVFDQDLKRQVDSMWHTMYEAPGIGLAAPQVADARRIFVMDCSLREDATRRFVCINPELHHLKGEILSPEGCLSFPGLSVEVPRAEALTLKAQNINGEWFEVELEGLEAICAQHEFDHLEGRSFLDLLGPLEQVAAMQDYIEALKTMSLSDREVVLARAEQVLFELTQAALFGGE